MSSTMPRSSQAPTSAGAGRSVYLHPCVVALSWSATREAFNLTVLESEDKHSRVPDRRFLRYFARPHAKVAERRSVPMLAPGLTAHHGFPWIPCFITMHDVSKTAKISYDVHSQTRNNET